MQVFELWTDDVQYKLEEFAIKYNLNISICITNYIREDYDWHGQLYVLSDGLWNTYYFSHCSCYDAMKDPDTLCWIDMNMHMSGPFTKEEMMKVVDADTCLSYEKKKRIQEIISNS